MFLTLNQSFNVNCRDKKSVIQSTQFYPIKQRSSLGNTREENERLRKLQIVAIQGNFYTSMEHILCQKLLDHITQNLR